MLIRNKIYLAFGIIGLLAGIGDYIAYRIDTSIEFDVLLCKVDTEKNNAAEEMEKDLFNLWLPLENYIQEKSSTSAAPALGDLPSENAKILERITAVTTKFGNDYAAGQQAELRSLKLTESEGIADEIEELKNEISQLDKIGEIFGHYKNQIQEALADARPGAVTMVQLKNGHEQMVAAMDDYHGTVDRMLDRETGDIGAALEKANWTVFYSSTTILLLGGIVAWSISRAVIHPIRRLTEVAGQIGQGNLNATVDIRSRDEFGTLAKTFNRMAVDLRSSTVSKDYMDGIIKSMVNTLIVTSPEGIIKFVNVATLKLLGYTEAELIGQPLSRVMGTHLVDGHSVVKEVFEKGEVTDGDFTYLAKNGNSIPVTFSASQLCEGSTVTGLVCIAQDIMDRKDAEIRLEKVHKDLLEASRQAGMTEVASSVLHNVGNVLNSVNVSATLVFDLVRNSKVTNLTKVNAMLRAHEADLAIFLTNDPQGRQVCGYLGTLAEHLTVEQSTILKELESLRKNMEHIKEIVTMQQKYSKVYGIAETLPIVDLVEDALRMNAGAFVRHEVALVRDYQVCPNVTVEKHKVLQILVNIMRNAKYACDESGRTDKQMKVSISDCNNRLKISVIDNGVGILPENLAKIFAHGFTTRKDGHGYGLHSGALAAKDIGGSLTAYSKGPGQGATFVLELPYKQEGIRHD